jgi:Domain of unknown function (DUF4118)
MGVNGSEGDFLPQANRSSLTDYRGGLLISGLAGARLRRSVTGRTGLEGVHPVCFLSGARAGIKIFWGMKRKRWRGFGTALCLLAAGFLCLLFRASAIKGLVPFLLVAVLLFVAMRFGTGPAILGTLGAAVVFAELLFEPRFSLRIKDTAERDNLVWMVIIGIAGSEVLGARPKKPGGGDTFRAYNSGNSGEEAADDSRGRTSQKICADKLPSKRRGAGASGRQ